MAKYQNFHIFLKGGISPCMEKGANCEENVFEDKPTHLLFCSNVRVVYANKD